MIYCSVQISCLLVPDHVRHFNVSRSIENSSTEITAHWNIPNGYGTSYNVSKLAGLRILYSYFMQMERRQNIYPFLKLFCDK